MYGRKGNMGTCNSNSRSSASGAGSANIKSQLVDGIPDSQRKDFVYQLRMYESVYDVASKAGNTDYINDFKKYEYVSVNEALPKVEGTEKQISYAESLRQRAIRNQIDSIIKMFGNSNTRKQRVDQIISQQNRKAKVSSFNDIVNALLKENQNGAFYRLKNMKTAREIIDNFR